MELLNLESFQSKIFDYKANKDWKFKGDRPTIIDFYADWCGPCKMLAPIFDKLSQEYEGQIDFYKVDTEDQQELASLFQVSSLPSILFIPLDSPPQMAQGALPEANLKEAIKEIFNISDQ
jgi:thioredoxin 1